MFNTIKKNKKSLYSFYFLHKSFGEAIGHLVILYQPGNCQLVTVLARAMNFKPERIVDGVHIVIFSGNQLSEKTQSYKMFMNNTCK